MTAVWELLLVLGLLVSARCEVRARDPEVEEEEDGHMRGRGGGESWEQGQAGHHFAGFGIGQPPHLRNLPHGHRPDGQGLASPLGHGHHSLGHQGHQGQHPFGLPEEVPPTPGTGGNYPARTGNWCAFEHKRTVTTAVACGTERYTIKSQSPCPNGTPDCQLVMYKLSTRPVYRLKEKVITALLWRCCPGHGGDDCEETVPSGQVSPGDSREPSVEQVHLRGTDLQAQAVHVNLQQSGDLEKEQNDHQLYDASLPDNSSNSNTHTDTMGQRPVYPDPDQQPPPGQGHGPSFHQQPHHGNPTAGHHDLDHGIPDTHHHDRHHDRHTNVQRPAVVDVSGEWPPDATSPLPLPHMMALIMSQLRPVLEGFNHTLEHLSQQVGHLAQDVAELQRVQWGEEVAGQAFAAPRPSDMVEDPLDDKLDETFQHLDEVRQQIESHRAEMENRLHSYHVMLTYNLTSLKTDVDMKLKRNQKLLQVNLQAMNSSLADMRQEQEQLAEELQRRQEEEFQRRQEEEFQRRQEEERRAPPTSHSSLPSPQPLPPQQALDRLWLWEAIERLDNKVVNNTVKVNGLMEDVETTMGSIQVLAKDYKRMDERIEENMRKGQILFMETGLEVEAAKVTVLNRVSELGGNLSMRALRFQEMESDVDYLFTEFYKLSNVSRDCSDKIVHLEHGLVNVTALANDNRLALDGSFDAGINQWGQAGDWEPAVEGLQQRLQRVTESLAFEQDRTRTLQSNVTQLSSSVAGTKEDVAGLRDNDQKLNAKMRHLESSFNSLLEDAVRHNYVLETLLGEEVLEFMNWPMKDKEGHSIPALKERIRLMQEQISGHNLSITSLLEGGPAEAPAADQPSSHVPDWTNGYRRTNGDHRRERQVLYSDKRNTDSDSADQWRQEKPMQKPDAKVDRNSSHHNEAPPSGVEAKLQAEVTWLRRGLEDHLRIFKNIFSNTDTLAASDNTLDIDKLWALVRKKGGKNDKRKSPEKRRDSPSNRGNYRSRRDVSGNVPAIPWLGETNLLFLASPLATAQVRGRNMLFDTCLNHGKVLSNTGTFTAPAEGTYLFMLTLDLKPGPTLVGLRRESGVFAALHSENVTERGPATRLCLFHLQQGEEVHLELKEGAVERSQDNIFAGFVLHQST